MNPAELAGLGSHLLPVDVLLDHRLQPRLGEGQGGHVPGLGGFELDLVARGELALLAFGARGERRGLLFGAHETGVTPRGVASRPRGGGGARGKDTGHDCSQH